VIEFAYPQVFLLAIPVGAILLRLRARRKLLLGLQVAVAALILLCLSQPKLRLAEKGTDVVVVADRSLSMPPEAQGRIDELIKLVAEARGPGDRLGVVTFGDGVQVQMLPSGSRLYEPDPKHTDPNATDLREGLETTLSIIPADKRGRILFLSDGEYTGPSPISVAREAASRGVPIDYRLFGRPEETDIAVERLVLPRRVSSGEPFQFSAIVHADRPISADYLLMRGDKVLARSRGRFHAGTNRLVFRDLLTGRGVCEYRLKLVPKSDARSENNIGRGVVEVVNAPALMVVNTSGRADSLTLALRKARIPVNVFPEERAPLNLDTLQGYRGVILENVPASKLRRPGMLALARFVESLGGGLLLTGGEQSFANGGYYRSPLDPVLPVSMEVRQEHRKVGIALGIALDRSGSMQAPVGRGLTKMDLANLGTVAALEVLGPNDSVAVIAVDSAAHVIQPLTPCDNREAISERVRRIESMGGGIFVFTALLAAGKQLEWAKQATKHVILFADAADSEEPGKYKELLKRFRKMNITVSVIGLGTERDSDAEFLKDIAHRGDGQIFFTDDPNDLPRLFAHDTITVTRSTFVEEPTPLKSLPGMLMLTRDRYQDIPRAGGYNITSLRPRATKGITTVDEYNAPALAFWQYGLGRAAAFTPEVDGRVSGDLLRWKRYGDFLVTLGRYLVGDSEPESVEAKMSLEGGEGIVTVELDPEKPPPGVSNPMAIVIPPPRGGPAPPIKLPLEWVGPAKLEARLPVKEVGTYRAAVVMGGSKVLRTNPVTLPYAPEFAPRRGRMSGKETLKLLAKITGGKERLSMEGIFTTQGTASRAVPRDITLPLLVLLLVLVVVEIAERRLTLLTTAWRLATRGVSGAAATVSKASSSLRLPRRRAKRRPAPVRTAAEEELAAQPQPEEAEAPSEPAAPKEAEDAMDRALRRVKRRRRS